MLSGFVALAPSRVKSSALALFFVYNMQYMFAQLISSEKIVRKAKSWPLLVGSAVVLAVLLVGMLNFMSPMTVGPNGILLFFLLAYLFSVVAALVLLKTWRLVFRKKFSAVKAMYLATTIAFAPVMLMALNTLNQLQVIDVVLVMVFECLALFYIFRRLE